MTLKLMYITNQEDIALIAEKNGVDWIFVDLEINGKDNRQGHLDSVISRHDIEDVKKIKRVLKKSKLLVRVNPIYEGSKDEIDKVITYGADIVMLPYFKTEEEVKLFINYVKGRAQICLLYETSEAVEDIDAILKVKGIDYIHIGLNDLHISRNKEFMFELLTDGTVEMICNKIKKAGISYGFGGMAQLGHGDLPSENILAEHYRLGSSMVILSRGFCNVKRIKDIAQISNVFEKGVNEIRLYELRLLNESETFFEENKKLVHDQVNKLIATNKANI
jgi:2-keto-3-deoxy-L-rhamnonate aldolase RhmA